MYINYSLDTDTIFITYFTLNFLLVDIHIKYQISFEWIFIVNSVENNIKYIYLNNIDRTKKNQI